jgi:hypothetical protein
VKTYPTHSGQFARRPHFSNEEFETICSDELESVGLLPKNPEPIRIDRFIEKRFGISHEYEDLPQPFLGVTIFGERGVERILVARRLDEEGTLVSQRRARTTLAHEAGHGLLHTHLFSLDSCDPPLFGDFSDPSAPRVLCKIDLAEASGHAARYEGDWAEFQANRAMAALVLPRGLVQSATAPYLVSVGTLGRKELGRDRSDEAALALAEIFDVNPIAVRFRLEHLYSSSAQAQGNL